MAVLSFYTGDRLDCDERQMPVSQPATNNDGQALYMALDAALNAIEAFCENGSRENVTALNMVCEMARRTLATVNKSGLEL